MSKRRRARCGKTTRGCSRANGLKLSCEAPSLTPSIRQGGAAEGCLLKTLLSRQRFRGLVRSNFELARPFAKDEGNVVREFTVAEARGVDQRLR
jgi:hypothetical protein